MKIVTGAPGGLELTIDEPIDRASFYELVGLMTRYGLDTQCLKPLCESNPDSWFKDNKNYWHAAVFSKGDS